MRTTAIGMISVILAGMCVVPMLVQTEPPRAAQLHGVEVPATGGTACGHAAASGRVRAAPASTCGSEAGAQVAVAR